MRITILIRAIQKTYMIINRIYNILIHKKISCKKRKRKCKSMKKKGFISKNKHVGKKHETNIKGFESEFDRNSFCFSISVRKCNNE